MANHSGIQPAEVPSQLLIVTSISAGTVFLELTEKWEGEKRGN